MKKNMQFMSLAVLMASIFTPVVQAEGYSVALITDQSNYQANSFSQNAVEGLNEFANNHSIPLEEGGAIAMQAFTETDYITRFVEATENDYDLIIGLGAQTEIHVEEFANANPDKAYAIIDSAIDLPNVTSVLFKDYESAFLAGIAAALETKSEKVGFIGGLDNETINAFEAGFLAGVEEINPDIEVQVTYLNGFDDANGATQATHEMIESGADIVFHAAGQAGLGMFSAIRQRLMENPEQELWAIGADVDQTREGAYFVGEEKRSFTLTSTLKKAGEVIRDIAEQSYNGELEAGNIQYGVADEAIDISAGQLEGETYDIVSDYRDQIRAGELDVTALLK